jgi:hypothetical protein
MVFGLWPAPVEGTALTWLQVVSEEILVGSSSSSSRFDGSQIDGIDKGFRGHVWSLLECLMLAPNNRSIGVGPDKLTGSEWADNGTLSSVSSGYWL